MEYDLNSDEKNLFLEKLNSIQRQINDENW